MCWNCVVVVDSILVTQLPEFLTVELGSIVSDNGVWYPESVHNIFLQEACSVFLCYVHQ